MTDTTRVGAVVLAAGFGTRLAPLTDATPKPLLDVGGEPVASHLVTRLRAIDQLDQVVVATNGCHPEQWTNWRESLPNEPAVRVISNGITTNEDRAGAVRDLAAAIAALEACHWIVVLAGDNLIDESLQPHVDAARIGNRPAVLCRDLGNDVPPGRFGEITIDEHGLIRRFREKPADPQSPYVATCTYVLPGQIGAELDDFLRGGNPDSPGEFVGWLAARRPVLARVIRGRYFDIGNHETLAAARREY